MKKIALLVLINLYGSMIYAENLKSTEVQPNSKANSSVTENTIRIQTRPEIVGLWGMHIANKNKCVEYYNFKSNSELLVKSGSEWSTGIYDYQPTPDINSVLSALTFQIQFDNNAVDCSGIQEDQTGEISQYYVKWKNPNTLSLCNGENSDQCFATLKRVLP
ncbi:hypothetical protein SKM51_10385 [Acinetobacter faecalis]|uniref:Uncharacterized protein n=1 Tax=Acinetobacter faecalis TaxID=2665161 RepID=A0AB35UY99_9GAMM|nr:hypothetical protein [Acinetobacter faecalis]MDY6487592.1 hypothetical protein [Acinetobacter faecalis]